MSWRDVGGEGGVRFDAPAYEVVGYQGRGVDGAAYLPSAGIVFLDAAGDPWWIIFQESPGVDSRRAQVRGDVLACSEHHDELVHVRILAADVLRVDADAAFRQNAPVSFEEAAEVAARIPGPVG
ncbi:hypothetical protein GCM10009712_40180 [Pseudarthrobacter sulfonivorans]|uniref:hypothetical protein n=1 Tax=Pseudarthrobacter sulfonivorans TaxID=121292 RepID=UPI00168BD872|nr:hypothetical protein [Pseudarthrobacter sulfonivorans]